MFLQKNSQNIDRLIKKIKLVKMDRCSLSAEDCSLLDEVIVVLNQHKKKWKKDDTATLLVILKIVELLSKFFC
jgi:ribosomal protein S15P/S13E